MTFYGSSTPNSSQTYQISSAAVMDRSYSRHAIPDEVYSDDRALAGVTWKRGLDVLLSVTALILLLPAMLAAAAAVKLTSSGPVFFCQERVGLNRRETDRRHPRRYKGAERRNKDRRVVVNFGKPFKMYKFRTMVATAEKGTPVWAKKNDARITSVGKLLRRTRIDEIPQFLNVLQGDMSIVGPRPERAYFMAQIEKELPEFQSRLRTKPGITGLAQVELGYTNTLEGMHNKLTFDLRYIRNLKPTMDLRILFKTVSVVFTGKGAY